MLQYNCRTKGGGRRGWASVLDKNQKKNPVDIPGFILHGPVGFASWRAEVWRIVPLLELHT